jgi:acyl-CoA synthetase (AMP-forming)/AMP-acid ligase II
MTSAAALSTWLSRFAPEAVVWTDGAHDWTAGALLAETLAAQTALGPRLAQRTVALAVRPAPLLARWLVRLDGLARAVLLVPPDWPESAWSEPFAAAGVEVVVADRPPSTPRQAEYQPAEPIPIGPIGSDPTDRGGGETVPVSVADTRLIIPTSGTTGTPKLVSHTRATLTRTIKPGEAEAIRCWGLLYELGRFAGLQVFLQALAARATLVFTDNLPDLEARLELLAARGCNALSATPTLWRKILISPAGRRLPLRQITLGGEIADDLVLTALARAFPQARVTHIYASTEAGVGFSVKDGRAGFPASYLTEPPGGVELKVDATGRLWLRPPLRGQEFVGGGGVADAEGWIDSGDLVERRGERYYFLGRANGAINVGGDKVFPEEVERVILELPEIALARVTGRRNPITGALVEAVVVPRDPAGATTGSVALARRVREHCAARLPRFKVPAVVQVVTDLTTEGTGKLVRR